MMFLAKNKITLEDMMDTLKQKIKKLELYVEKNKDFGV